MQSDGGEVEVAVEHRGGWWVGVAAIGMVLLSACSRSADVAVTTDTLSPAAAKAVDCASQIQQWIGDRNAMVFFEPSATDSQIEAVRKALATDEAVSRVTFVSREDAHKELLELFADAPAFTENVDVALMPPSFRFAYADPTDGASPGTAISSGDVLDSYRRMAGVRDTLLAQTPRCSDDPAMARAAERAIANGFGDNDLIVFMLPAAKDQIDPMRSELLASPGVRGIVYVSQAEAMVEFQCLFADSPDMTSGITSDILPPSFRIDLGDDPAAIAAAKKAYEDRAGVRAVITRPTPAELLRGSIGPVGGAHAPPPDCAVAGERIR